MLKDKVIVVTGASAGIGAATAELAAKQGARLVLSARRKGELEAVAQRCGPGAVTVVGDMTRRADVDRLASEALARCGHIDIWVNNVGRGITRLPSQLTDEDLDEMLTVNVKSALYGMQAVLPHFKARKAGHLINVSSMLGRVPFAVVRSAYSASKHFLNALTANLRMELRADYPGITVACFLPGAVATDFGLNARHGGIDSRQLPNSQSAEEVAQALVGAMLSKKADVYSRDGMQDQVVAYFSHQDITAVEARFGVAR